LAITLEELRDTAKGLSDLVDTDFVGDEMWNQWVWFGVQELHRAVTNEFKDTYFRTTTFTLADGEYQYTLPTNIHRVKGVTLNPGTLRRLTVRRFNFAERDSFKQAGPGVCPLRRYNPIGSGLLQIEPQEHAAGDYALYWVPKPAALVADSDELDPELEPFAEFVATCAAIKGCIKGEDYDQANFLRSQLKGMREDMAAALETDESPATIINVHAGRTR
jgi:hypothetical protein